MTLSFLNSQRGWVSLPIIVLLIAVSALSIEYQENILASYKWRGHLNDIETSQKVWEEFHSDFIESPSFHLATLSDCVGFCPLLDNQEKTWTQGDETLHYQWSRYDRRVVEESEVEPEEIQISYRLCATQNQLSYRCWWWRDGKLLSNGWLSVN